MKKLLRLVPLSALAIGGIAVAAHSVPDWDFFRSDLIRCQDAAAHGHPACGSTVTGTDPLKSGRIHLNGDDILVKLGGAASNTTYTVGFITLHNSGGDVSGPYTFAGNTVIGTLTTNGNGNVAKHFTDPGISGPTLGYFVVYKVTASPTNEFVTGFDP